MSAITHRRGGGAGGQESCAPRPLVHLPGGPLHSPALPPATKCREWRPGPPTRAPPRERRHPLRGGGSGGAIAVSGASCARVPPGPGGTETTNANWGRPDSETQATCDGPALQGRRSLPFPLLPLPSHRALVKRGDSDRVGEAILHTIPLHKSDRLRLRAQQPSHAPASPPALTLVAASAPEGQPASSVARTAAPPRRLRPKLYAAQDCSCVQAGQPSSASQSQPRSRSSAACKHRSMERR